MRTIITFIGSFLTAIVVYGMDETNNYETNNYNTVLYGPRAIVDPDMQGTVDSWFKGAKTNNIVCAISFAPVFEKGSPIFYVNLINTTTNYIRGLLAIPIQNRANIGLMDSEKNVVPKTEAGKKYNVWTDQQIKDWFEDNRKSLGLSDILVVKASETQKALLTYFSRCSMLKLVTVSVCLNRFK